MRSTRLYAGVGKDGRPRLSLNYAWLRGCMTRKLIVSPVLPKVLTSCESSAVNSSVAILETSKVIMKAQTSTFKCNLDQVQGPS